MSNNLSPSEQLAFVTTRIECETNLGGTAVGTGFFFSFKLTEKQHIPVIVTNRHVIENSKRAIFQLTEANENGDPMIGKFKPIMVEDLEQLWSRWICLVPRRHGDGAWGYG